MLHHVLVFFVVSDGTFASPFHFIVPPSLKVPDDDLIKVFMGVAWNSCSCANWNGIEGFGTSWIKAPLLKKTVPVGDRKIRHFDRLLHVFFIDEYLAL